MEHFTRVLAINCLAHPTFPQVIATGAGEATTAAVAQVFPDSMHKYGVFHSIQSLRKNAGGCRLGARIVAEVVRQFEAAAFATTEEVSGRVVMWFSFWRRVRKRVVPCADVRDGVLR